MEDFPKRGNIYWVEFDPTVGNEQAGRRPAVVVSHNVGNEHSGVVTVIPFSTSIPRRRYPQDVHFKANEALPEPGVAKCAQIRTVSKKRVKALYRWVRPAKMADINAAISYVLALDD